MNPPSTPFQAGSSSNAVSTPTPSLRGRPRGSSTGAKRGRKPRGAAIGVGTTLGRTPETTTQAAVTSSPSTTFTTTQYVHWAAMQNQTQTGTSAAGASTSTTAAGTTTNGTTSGTPTISTTYTPSTHYPNVTPSTYTSGVTATTTGATTSTSAASSFALPNATGTGTSTLDAASLLRLASGSVPVLPTGAGGVASAVANVLSLTRPPGTGDDDGDGDDEMLPAMADDDYSAQLSFQSQSKDNLKVLMDNFSAAQYDRFEAYRRHALPKAAVRKVLQQTLGQQVSQPVAQIVAGFAKVFVGEIVEKARAVQKRRGESGPLSPDHLREAYRMYQEETGRVGAARPLRAKRLFVR
ncbi:Transcription initiation factor TFIID subunit 11 [Termitomyces sp. T112]|nr:Transcription initiation factor TFIID subunit 11 [Termitomyces sp. T112]